MSLGRLRLEELRKPLAMAEHQRQADPEADGGRGDHPEIVQLVRAQATVGLSALLPNEAQS